MIKMPELLPCPFCGGHVQMMRLDPADGIYSIYCSGCKAMTKWNIEMDRKETYGENAKKWAEKWNRRKNNDQTA